jgi:hypothetical protein
MDRNPPDGEDVFLKHHGTMVVMPPATRDPPSNLIVTPEGRVRRIRTIDVETGEEIFPEDYDSDDEPIYNEEGEMIYFPRIRAPPETWSSEDENEFRASSSHWSEAERQEVREFRRARRRSLEAARKESEEGTGEGTGRDDDDDDDDPVWGRDLVPFPASEVYVEDLVPSSETGSVADVKPDPERDRVADVRPDPEGGWRKKKDSPK